MRNRFSKRRRFDVETKVDNYSKLESKIHRIEQKFRKFSTSLFDIETTSFREIISDWEGFVKPLLMIHDTSVNRPSRLHKTSTNDS